MSTHTRRRCGRSPLAPWAAPRGRTQSRAEQAVSSCPPSRGLLLARAGDPAKELGSAVQVPERVTSVRVSEIGGEGTHVASYLPSLCGAALEGADGERVAEIVDSGAPPRRGTNADPGPLADRAEGPPHDGVPRR